MANKQVIVRVASDILEGIIERHFASWADDDLIEFAIAFFAPECAADASQIVAAAEEYVS